MKVKAFLRNDLREICIIPGDIRAVGNQDKTPRLRLIAGLGVTALLAGFLTYALIKNARITAQNEQINAQNTEILAQRDEILKQRDEIVDHHMQTLIEQSKTSVTTGNKIPAKAILAEAAALRETVQGANDDALYSALEASVYTGSFETIQTIDNDNRRFSSIVFPHFGHASPAPQTTRSAKSASAIFTSRVKSTSFRW